MPIFKLLSKNFTYQKKDKLKSRKQTQFLFSKGTAITMHPIRLLYTIEKVEAGIFPNGLLQAGVGAPSRQFRKAVQRNRVKRLLREGYRLEKPNFTNGLSLTNTRLNLFFLYVDVNVQTQQQIQTSIKLILQKLADKLKPNVV
ncbi:MAG: ribonuclease P protein component [Bacteroidetes bacterium]|jgi:ribonuclease P protein component|nr:ribonuclease P protein component [Bacteroidota bacterium]